MNATTLEHVKEWMHEAGAGREIDGRLEELLPAVSAAIESMLHTELERKRRVEFPEIVLGARILRLAVRPVSKVSSVRYSAFRNFEDNYSELAEGEWWTLSKDAGILTFDNALETDRQGVVRVEYTGGYAATAEEMRSAAPDIAQAACMWVADWMDRGYSISARGRQFADGSFSQDFASRVPLAVMALLNPGSHVG